MHIEMAEWQQQRPAGCFDGHSGRFDLTDDEFHTMQDCY